MGWTEQEDVENISLYLTLHCRLQNDFAVRWAALIYVALQFAACMTNPVNSIVLPGLDLWLTGNLLEK